MKFIKGLLTGSLLATAGAFFVLPGVAEAHPGELDSMGCHYARNYRNYHCHEGPLAGQTFQSRAQAIRHWNRARHNPNNKNREEENNQTGAETKNTAKDKNKDDSRNGDGGGGGF